MIKLHHGDCLTVMASLPDASIDAVITDPPYGTTACKWDSIIQIDSMWSELRRVCKLKAAVALFSSQPFTSELVMSNPRNFRHEWVWSKSIVVFSQQAPIYFPQKSKGKAYRLRSGATSGGDTTFDKSVGRWLTESNGDRFPVSVLTFSNDTGLHPTQKPVDLLRYLVRTYTTEGDTVLDFTFGSGTTGVACVLEGRNFIGIEKEREYFNLAKRRITEAQRELKAA